MMELELRRLLGQARVMQESQRAIEGRNRGKALGRRRAYVQNILRLKSDESRSRDGGGGGDGDGGENVDDVVGWLRGERDGGGLV